MSKYLLHEASAHSLREMTEKCGEPFLTVCLQDVNLCPHAEERIQRLMDETGTVMAYSDYADANGRRVDLIDCQPGSVRDNFQLGPVAVFRSDWLRRAVAQIPEDYRYAALYAVRLRAMSQQRGPLHLPEVLYSLLQNDQGRSSQFDYVDPANRQYQLEMEDACTRHLQDIGALIPAGSQEEVLPIGQFPYEASVIIPVRDRRRTIAQAVESALSQRTDLPFNVLVVDNHSTDGTSLILDDLSAHDSRLKILHPRRRDLGIGGCWNMAVNDPDCGRFAVQLDSDDVYSGPDTLQRIVSLFHTERCAMVIGAYRLTDIEGRELPPGVIDHTEWTPQNGTNNALRVNGLGAPRAFYTPLVRQQFPFPNVSYGEDYAVALAISAQYRVGRIYQPVYTCRRWEGNSDAGLTRAVANAHDHYKDTLRTWEIRRRQNMLRR